MNFQEKIKSQRIVIAIALILISFNFALKGTYTIIALIVGFAFLGMAFFLLFRLKKVWGEWKPKILKPWLPWIEEGRCAKDRLNKINSIDLVLQFDSFLINWYSFAK